MSERKRILLLILIMIIVSLFVAGITIYLLYEAAFEENRERLVETAQSRARLIEAVARFDAIYSKEGYPGGATAATLSQITDAHTHFKGLAETGEFTLARREADNIVFLLRHRHGGLDQPKPIRFDSELAEPMRLALSGQSGTVVGLDYRGETVLAAYEPVSELNLGIVAKIDLAEIRASFMKAGIVAICSAFLVVLVGAFLFLRISNPMIRRLEESEARLQKLNQELEQRVEERTRELEEAQEQMIRNEKLAVLGQLAGGMSHELRNPLGAIKNAAYFLNMALEEPEPEVKETLEILHKEVATSEGIISSLLEFARPKPPTRRKVIVNEIVQDSLSRITVPENVKVVSQLDEALPSLLADPDQLAQVFGNIILNAIQAMSDGGQLTISSATVAPQCVSVSFTDTGVGIPQEKLGEVFEPLFTTKARGIGLGLALTKTLVEGHGGRIEVESKAGKGSTFTVNLPMGEK